jgi:E3 ubiquitin-protein ligase HUWE1
MLAQCFEQAGGLDRVFFTYDRFREEAATALPESPNTDEKLRSLQAVGGLRISQDLLERLTSHKSFPETSQPMRADPEQENSDAYEPHEFLIRLRARILPVVLDTWNAPWLRSAPPNVVRQVFRIIYNIINGEGEARNDYNPANSLLALPAFFSGLRSLPVDEATVQQLIDMGFPRSAATAALRRTSNVNVATEYLISHPQLVAQSRQDDEQSGTQGGASSGGGESAPTAPASETAANPDPSPDVEMSDAPSAPETSSTSDPEKDEKDEKRKRIEETKAELDALRAKVKDEFLSKALSLAKDYPDIVFELRHAFKSFATDRSQTYGAAMNLLLDNLRTHLHSDPGAARSELRLLALLASDEVYHVEIEFRHEKVIEVVNSYVEEYFKTRPPADKRPEWLAPLMLIIEALLSLSTVPRAAPAAAYPSDEGPDAINQVLTGPSYDSEREKWFDLAMDVLRKGDQETILFNSTMRLILALTSRPETAQQFVQQDGLKLLLSPTNRESDAGQEYTIHILRHVVESREVIDSIIDGEVNNLLAKQRVRPPDATSFVSALKHAALRDPASFLRAVHASAKLTGPEPPNVYHVAARDDKKPSSESATGTGELTKSEDTEMQVDEPAKSSNKEAVVMPRPPGVDNVIHLLMSELLACQNRVMAFRGSKPSQPPAATPGPSSSTEQAASGQPSGSTTQEQKPELGPAVKEMLNVRFLLACLIELLYSYVPCKTSFIHFSKRKSGEDGPSATKPKAFFLNFVLNELVPLENLSQPPDVVGLAARTVRVSEWSSLLIVALCSDGGIGYSAKDLPPEIVTVRKLVLDAISKSFKDTSASSEPNSVRYSRLSALSDLCNRLLTPASIEPRRVRSAARFDELHIYMGKLMLEKNFASVLTSALADVDLNFPRVENLINKILRPMQYLTKLATKVGRSGGDRKSFTPDPLDYDDHSSSESGSGLDSDATDEHHTEEHDEDDIYRTSALGMYQGELEVCAWYNVLVLLIFSDARFSLATEMITCQQAPPRSMMKRMKNWKTCRMTGSVSRRTCKRRILQLLICIHSAERRQRCF